MSASKEVVVYKQNEGVTISQWKSLLNRAAALGMVKVNALFTVLFGDEEEQDDEIFLLLKGIHFESNTNSKRRAEELLAPVFMASSPGNTELFERFYYRFQAKVEAEEKKRAAAEAEILAIEAYDEKVRELEEANIDLKKSQLEAELRNARTPGSSSPKRKRGDASDEEGSQSSSRRSSAARTGRARSPGGTSWIYRLLTGSPSRQ
jgi:hypothetical protein